MARKPKTSKNAVGASDAKSPGADETGGDAHPEDARETAPEDGTGAGPREQPVATTDSEAVPDAGPTPTHGEGRAADASDDPARETAEGDGFVMVEGEAEDPDKIAAQASDRDESGRAESDKSAPVPVPAPDPLPPPRRSGGMSMLLGGALAALFGAGAIYLAEVQGWTDLGGPDAELVSRIETLEMDLAAAQAAAEEAEAEIAALKEAEPDLSGVTAANDETRGVAEAAGASAAQNAEALAELRARLEETAARLQEVAVQQIPEAELPQAISDAYDAKLEDLLATIDGRFQDMQARADEALAGMQAQLDERLSEIESMQQQAAQAEAEAEAAERAAEARAALARIVTALEDGTAYAEPLEQLREVSDAEIPEVLAANAETGIPSLRTLTETFPDYARPALTTSARQAAEAGQMSRFQAFLRSELGARSLAAREGDDPDAILSRAEAAASDGLLETALQELEALPPEGQEAMSDWVEMAQTRIEAVNAAADLSAELQQN